MPIQSHSENGSPDLQAENTGEATMLDYIELMLKYKKLIGILTGTAIIVSVVVSLLLPVRYTATARILPPNDSRGSLGTLLAQAEGIFGGLAEGLVADKTPSELYVGILKSRTVADELIQHFNLKQLYGSDYIEDVCDELARRTHIQVGKKNQIITIAVEAGSPQRAADMANTYVDALDRINRKLNLSEAQKKRQFLEERLSKVRLDLAKAEDALREFQERYKLVSLEEQAKAAIDAASEIKAEIVADEIKLEIHNKFGTRRQNEAVLLMAEIKGLKKQLARLQTGEPAADSESRKPGDTGSDFFIPIGTMPDLGLKLARLSRNAKIQEKVFELMITQFEAAKIEEAKDVNIIQVLDRAVPPEKRSYPSRAFFVILCTFTAFCGGVVIAFLIEYWFRLQLEHPEQFGAIKANLGLRVRPEDKT